jgi:hypothetical protein
VLRASSVIAFSVMTICNLPLGEYFEDTLGTQGHKRPCPRTVGTRVPINTPVQYPGEGRLTELLPLPVEPCKHSFLTPVGSTRRGRRVPTRTLSSLMCTRENFPVGHPSQIAPSQARLTWRFFRDMLSKKKMHLVDMITLLILLSLRPGCHIPGAKISQTTPLRRPTSSSINPNLGTSPLSHVCVSSVVICHAM